MTGNSTVSIFIQYPRLFDQQLKLVPDLKIYSGSFTKEAATIMSAYETTDQVVSTVSFNSVNIIPHCVLEGAVREEGVGGAFWYRITCICIPIDTGIRYGFSDKLPKQKYAYVSL